VIDRRFVRSRLKTWLLPLLFATVGLTVACYPTLFSGFARVQNDPWDTRLLNYVLEHDYLWLARAPFHLDLWSPPIFYPEPNTALYTELVLGVMPYYAAWRAIGFAPDTSFQFWMLTSLTLNFATMYFFLTRGLGFGSIAGCFGSFLFSFGSPRLNQLNHQFLLPQFFTVLALFALCRLFQAHRGGQSHGRCAAWLAVLCGSIAAQIYATYHHGWFLSFAFAIAGGFALSIQSTRREITSILKAHWKSAAISASATAAVLAPLGLRYVAAARSVGFRGFWEAEGMLPRFQSWFYLGEENWLYGWMARRWSFQYLPMEWEQRLGLGFVTLAVVVWSLFRERHRPGVRILLGTWLAIVLASSMYRFGFSPWKWIFHLVPGANGIRAVARIGILGLIPASIGLALFVDRRGETRAPVLAMALSVFCLVEQGRRSLSYEKQPVRNSVSAVSAKTDRRCSAFFCSCADERYSDDCQLDAIWASVETGLPTVNGVSGNVPRGFEGLANNIVRSEADAQRLKDALGQWLSSHRRETAEVCWVRVPDPVKP